jgi:hypothetical protein
MTGPRRATLTNSLLPFIFPGGDHLDAAQAAFEAQTDDASHSHCQPANEFAGYRSSLL